MCFDKAVARLEPVGAKPMDAAALEDLPVSVETRAELDSPGPDWLAGMLEWECEIAEAEDKYFMWETCAVDGYEIGAPVLDSFDLEMCGRCEGCGMRGLEDCALCGSLPRGVLMENPADTLATREGFLGGTEAAAVAQNMGGFDGCGSLELSEVAESLARSMREAVARVAHGV